MVMSKEIQWQSVNNILGTFKSVLSNRQIEIPSNPFQKTNPEIPVSALDDDGSGGEHMGNSTLSL